MMKSKTRIRLGSAAAEEGETLNIQANKEEYLYPSLTLSMWAGKISGIVGKQMLLGSIILWSCSSTKLLHAGQETNWLCHFIEKYSQGVGLGAEFFCSSSPPLLKTPLFLLPCLHSVCLVKANMNVVWKTLPSSPGRSHLCPDRF